MELLPLVASAIRVGYSASRWVYGVTGGDGCNVHTTVCSFRLPGFVVVIDLIFGFLVSLFCCLICKHPVCYYRNYFVIYLTFNTRISIFR
jgi:hypothetical protein